MGSPPIPDRTAAAEAAKKWWNTVPANGHVQFSPPKKRVTGSVLDKQQPAPWLAAAHQVTYRHLRGTVTPSNPLRCIAHIDIDAAYAAMERVRLNIPEDVPLAVRQWQGLIAVNYPARAYGITRHETPADALKKCPHLMMVHCASYRVGDTEPHWWQDAKPETHKISLDPYRREALKILAVFKEHCPVVEKASIDESFLDLSVPVREKLLSLYPALADCPVDESTGKPDFDLLLPTPRELGVEIDWSRIGNVVPRAEVPASDSPFAHTAQEEEVLTWSDVALFHAAEIVMECRTQVQKRLGYTCSGGVAGNKMLAKLCSAYKKPNNQTVLRPSRVHSFLDPFPFQKIRNLGGKLGNQIKETWNVNTVSDMLTIPLPDLQAKLGEDQGAWVWEIVRGLDGSEVEAKTAFKSMLSSKNFRPSITRYEEAEYWISILATELHLRLREARELNPGLWPKTITFTHRSEQYVSRSHQLPFAFTSKLDIPHIQRFGIRLLRSALGDKNVPIKADTRIGPFNNLQLAFSGLEQLEEGQKGIEGFFTMVDPNAQSASRPQPEASNSKAEAKSKEQPDKEEKKRDRVETIDLLSSSPPASPAPKKARTSPRKQVKPKQTASWTCPKCKKTLSSPVPSESTVDETTKRLEDEHRDYHFARDLLEKERKKDHAKPRSYTREPALSDGSSSSSKKKGKVKVEEGQKSLTGFFKK